MTTMTPSLSKKPAPQRLPKQAATRLSFGHLKTFVADSGVAVTSNSMAPSLRGRTITLPAPTSHSNTAARSATWLPTREPSSTIKRAAANGLDTPFTLSSEYMCGLAVRSSSFEALEALEEPNLPVEAPPRKTRFRADVPAHHALAREADEVLVAHVPRLALGRRVA